MRYLIIFLSIFLFGYEAKVEPIYTYNLKSSVNGRVILVNKNLESKNLKNSLIIKLDDKVELAELKDINNQINILKKEIENQKEVVQRKKELYEKYKILKSKSLQEKDVKFFDYIASKNQLLSLKSKLSSLFSQKEKIKDLIDKKNIKFSGYLYSILVEKGDYVGIGTPVALGYDISKEKIDIYVPIDKIDEVKNKIVYINSKKSNFKISKIYKVTDTKYITSYKVELTGNGLKIGEVVRVDFKKE